ncbi:molybdopterin binding oxidoreductase [Cadophora sp. DSE1049]|nr:molybdopterin binding oxidoreductase [Cadophora sp. DSE1049]
MESQTSSQLRDPPPDNQEREACFSIDPAGFYIRHPPPPHYLKSFITLDSQLFQTIHMGAAVVDINKWMLVLDGLVNRPYSLTLEDLYKFPKTTITSFHECYGSPVKPPVENLWRIGNVEWTGVRLKTLLSLASPLPEAEFVWSEGLDHGKFHVVIADRYQKDLPLTKAMQPEVLVAYELNGEPLSKERGGPVRLVVPGWFGTNSTKWLCKLSLQSGRAKGPYTTTFYNAVDEDDPLRPLKPVWAVEPNSMIVKPEPMEEVEGQTMRVEGWAWSHDGIESVHVSLDDGHLWQETELRPRKESSWQRFSLNVNIPPSVDGACTLIARATSVSGVRQKDSGRRNHVHRVTVKVKK